MMNGNEQAVNTANAWGIPTLDFERAPAAITVRREILPQSVRSSAAPPKSN